MRCVQEDSLNFFLSRQSWLIFWFWSINLQPLQSQAQKLTKAHLSLTNELPPFSNRCLSSSLSPCETGQIEYRNTKRFRGSSDEAKTICQWERVPFEGPHASSSKSRYRILRSLRSYENIQRIMDLDQYSSQFPYGLMIVFILE